ncbi:hypothetical protein D3C72_2407030 [compost metagenome]
MIDQQRHRCHQRYRTSLHANNGGNGQLDASQLIISDEHAGRHIGGELKRQEEQHLLQLLREEGERDEQPRANIL